MRRLQSEVLSEARNVSHGFYGREGGVSDGLFASLNCGYGSNDEREHVRENRSRVALDLAVAEDRLLTVYQIHSSEAVIVSSPWAREDAPKADGMATNIKGIALGVLAADCAPVLFSDSVAGVVGCAHAGWQGAFKGIVEAVVMKMEELGSSRSNIVGCVGPCISQANYEVGPEFFDRFVDASEDFSKFFVRSGKQDHHMFDLPAFVSFRLGEARIRQREVLPFCTYAREGNYFSFRRATHGKESGYGRNLSAIMLRESH